MLSGAGAAAGGRREERGQLAGGRRREWRQAPPPLLPLEALVLPGPLPPALLLRRRTQFFSIYPFLLNLWKGAQTPVLCAPC